MPVDDLRNVFGPSQGDIEFRLYTNCTRDVALGERRNVKARSQPAVNSIEEISKHEYQTETALYKPFSEQS